jgi:hypothetical protein
VEHREVLRLALETSGHDFRGMEHFAAQDIPPLDVCLAEVDDCDVYVGVIGGLYGSCPHGRVIGYTELESVRATQSAKYQIWLVLDADADVKPNHIEQDPNKLARLQRFRARIERDHTVQTFKDPNEVAWKVLAALRVFELKMNEDANA